MNQTTALSGSAFYVDRSNRGRLQLTGRDRQSFLQGMVTNDVAALAPGQGCYAFVLDATAHVLADVRVVCRASDLLLDVEPGLAAFVAQTLDRYLIMEKCEIVDMTGATAQVFVGGEHAPRVLAHLGIANSETWVEGQNEPIGVGGVEATAAATRLIPGLGFDIYVPAGALPDLIEALRAAGAGERTAAALETYRIEAGVPRFGADIDATKLASETGQQARAISYRKGCYLGQEVVARIDARGHTNRTFVGFRLESNDVPASGEKVAVDNKEVGSVTSCVFSPDVNQPIALGYLRHEHAAPGTAVVIAGQPAVVATLPFVSFGEPGLKR